MPQMINYTNYLQTNYQNSILEIDIWHILYSNSRSEDVGHDKCYAKVVSVL